MAKKAPSKAQETLEQVKAMLSGASLTVRSWSVQRACSGAEVERAADGIGCDSQALTARKCLIDTRHPAWREVVRVKGQIKVWWEYNTMPYVVTGMRLFLRERRQDIWASATEWAKTLATAAQAIDEAREEVLAQARERLRSAYDPDYYPASWAGAFGLELREHSIEPPSYLMHTNAEEYQRELQRSLVDIQASMQRFETQCVQTLMQRSAMLANNLVTNTNHGVSDNVAAFQALFNRVSQMRFEGTQVFKAAMADARAIIDGASLEDLKKPGGIRIETRNRLTALLKRYKELQQTVVAKATQTEEPAAV